MNTELLHRFFNGQCSPKEVNEILRWIESPEGKKEFQKAFETFEQPTVSAHTPLDSHALLAKVKDRVKADQKKKGKASFQLVDSGRKRYSMFTSAVAASILLLISAAVFFYFSNHQANENREIALETGSMITKRTMSGQKRTIHLADGSVATLNANSSITYSKEFSDSVRLVRMHGEVYFEVAKDLEKPFVVSTSKLNTTALGTSFNINAYDDRQQQISLVEGKVKVGSQDSDLINYLEAGEEINLSNGAISMDTFDVFTKVLWKEGIIYFDNTPLDECFETLERWYGVKISVQGAGLSEKPKVSGRFDNDYLTNVLKSISYTHEFKYEIDKKRVHITFSK